MSSSLDNRALQMAIKKKCDKIEAYAYDSFEKEQRNILMAIGQEGVKKTKELITEYFYNKAPQSDFYIRLGNAGGFLSTISYTITEKKQVRIYCDWDKLKREYYDYHANMFDAHNGFDDKKFTEGVYDYIMNGIWNSPVGHPWPEISGGKGIGDEVNDALSDFFTGRARKAIVAFMKKYFKDSNVKHRVNTTLNANGARNDYLFSNGDNQRHKSSKF